MDQFKELGKLSLQSEAYVKQMTDFLTAYTVHTTRECLLSHIIIFPQNSRGRLNIGRPKYVSCVCPRVCIS